MPDFYSGEVPFYRKLGFKLAVLVLAIAIFPLVLIGIYGFSVAKTALGRQAIADLTLLAKANQGHVGSFLYQLEKTAVNFSSDGLIRRLTEEADSEALSQHLIENKLPLDTYLVGINVLDVKGRVIASTHQTEIGKDEKDDAYFIQGMKLAYSQALTVDYGLVNHFETHEPLIATIAPMVSLNNGQNVGLIVTYFKTGNLSALLSYGVSQRETLDVYLVNAKNLLMTKSHFADAQAILQQTVDTEPVRNCRDNQSTSGVWTNWRGEKVYGASVCFADFGWTLVTEIESSEVDKPAQALRNLITIAILLIGTISVFIGLVFAGGKIKSLQELSLAAHKISQGDLAVRVKVSSSDEFGRLAEMFNQMAVQLSEHIKQLEDGKAELEVEKGLVEEKAAEMERMNKLMVGRELKMAELKKELKELKGKI